MNMSAALAQAPPHVPSARAATSKRFTRVPSGPPQTNVLPSMTCPITQLVRRGGNASRSVSRTCAFTLTCCVYRRPNASGVLVNVKENGNGGTPEDGAVNMAAPFGATPKMVFTLDDGVHDCNCDT